MLKAELHAHINADPKDKKWIKYSAKELVDAALRQKFDVLAITCHNLMYADAELKEYAWSKGLLLIFGIEKDIENKHVLVYNITPADAAAITTFQDLKNLRQNKKQIFTIAAHPPYWGPSCLRQKIITHFDLFDAWEHSFLHNHLYNPNKKLMALAKKHNKPVVGNSDIHLLTDLGRTYSLIDALPEEQAVFQAIKEHKVHVVSKPLPSWEMIRIMGRAVWSSARHQAKKLSA